MRLEEHPASPPSLPPPGNPAALATMLAQPDVAVRIEGTPPGARPGTASTTQQKQGNKLHFGAAAARSKSRSSSLDVFMGLAWSSKALLLLGCAHTLAAAVFATTQFTIDWSWVLLQDTLLILVSAVLTLALLLDAFAKENAYQLLAALAMGLLNSSQLVVYLVTLHGHGSAAAVAICLALQAAAAAVARPAYQGFGWRMYSRIASNWRQKPEEQQRQRAAALARQRFAALAKLDALLLALLVLLAAVSGANPGSSAADGSGASGGSAAQQPHPLGLLVGAAAAAAPLLLAWLAACWLVAVRRRRRLAAAVDLTYPLCYVPPLLIMFGGILDGGQLSQPHAQAYLVAYPLMFLVARTATWWAARNLKSSTQHTGHCGPACCRAQRAACAAVGGGLQKPQQAAEEAEGDGQQLPLPPELLPLVRGAWLRKLPSRSGGSGCLSAGGEAGCMLELAGSGASMCSIALSSGPSAATLMPAGAASAATAAAAITATTCTSGSCRPAGAGGGAGRVGCASGKQRFFQLSHDAACIRWSWRKWVLVPHIQGVHCCDSSLTIQLRLLLEPDLRVQCSSRRQYEEWRQGLLLLQALLVQPEELLLPPPAAATLALQSGSGLARCSGCSTGSGISAGGASVGVSDLGGRNSSSLAREVILQMPLESGTSADLAAVGAAATGTAATAAGIGAVGADTSAASLQVLGHKLTCRTSRQCLLPGSHEKLQAAAARSQAALVAVVQRQQAVDGKQEQGPAAAAAAAAAGAAALAGGAAPYQQQHAASKPAAIQLIASSSTAELKIKLRSTSHSSTLEAQQLHHSGRQHQGQGLGYGQRTPTANSGSSGGGGAQGQGHSSAVGRLRSTLHRAITLPANLWRTSSSAAAAVAASLAPGDGGSAAAAAPADISPTRQPLTDPLRPSSSNDDLQAAGAAAMGRQGQGQGEGQHCELDAAIHERKLTLGVWAEATQQQPTQSQPHSQPQQHYQQHHHHQQQGALGQGASGAGAAGGGLGGGGGSGGRDGRTLVPLHGSFIHLQAFTGTTSSRLRSDPSPAAFSLAPASSLDASSSAAAAAAVTAAPSIPGSEASTPQHRSTLGSPLRSQRSTSPDRQQQLQSFQRYLQQQLALQQRGRQGSLGDSSSSGSGSESATASESVSPTGASPSRQQAEAAGSALLAPGQGSPLPSARGERRGYCGVQGGGSSSSPEGAQRVSPRAGLASTGAGPGPGPCLNTAASAGPGGATGLVAGGSSSFHRLSLVSSGSMGGPSGSGSSRVAQQQQHFAARMRSAGGPTQPAASQQAQQQQAPMASAQAAMAAEAEAAGGGFLFPASSASSFTTQGQGQPQYGPFGQYGWGEALGASEAGSAPPSGWAMAPLARAESTFSSWGLPTPTTATARTPFNGLSRFNSLAPSLQQTPLTTFRQHPHFAFSFTPQQPSSSAAAGAPGAAAGGAGYPTPAVMGLAGGGSGSAYHHRRANSGSFGALLAGMGPGGGGGGGSGLGAGMGAAAAAGGGYRAFGAGDDEDREGGGGPQEGALLQAASPIYYYHSPMSASGAGALGINVPVEMIAFEDLVFGKFLGEGSEGSVYAAWHRETPVAVKKTRSLVEIEMNLHAGSHDNVVGLRGLCSHGTHLYLVMELCPRGTLDVLIHKGQGGSGGSRLDPNKLLPIVRSIARGMLHLHTRRPAILHRDLKPGNLFIGHGGVVKVGDFGMSRYAAQWRAQEADGSLERTLTPGVIGTAAYSAPELLNAETPTEAEGRQLTPADEQRILKADVYSFGVTLFEIMERRRPFAGMDGFQIQTQWYLDPHSMRLPQPSVPDSLPPAARHVMHTLAGLVESCTQWDPDSRPSFQDILATLRSAAAGGGGGGGGGGVDTSTSPTPLVNPPF